jgi:hypothetical protein
MINNNIETFDKAFAVRNNELSKISKKNNIENRKLRQMIIVPAATFERQRIDN